MSGCSGSNEGSLLARPEDLREEGGWPSRRGDASCYLALLRISLAFFAASVSSCSVAAAAALPALAAGFGFY